MPAYENARNRRTYPVPPLPRVGLAFISASYYKWITDVTSPQLCTPSRDFSGWGSSCGNHDAAPPTWRDGFHHSDELKASLAGLEARLQARETADAARFAQVETRLEEHAAKLTDVPSTSQIVAAMEELLTKTMASLDDRLTTQAHSIEVLKTTVSQTDSLLERVLESLDSLQTFADPADCAEDAVLSQSRV